MICRVHVSQVPSHQQWNRQKVVAEVQEEECDHNLPLGLTQLGHGNIYQQPHRPINKIMHEKGIENKNFNLNGVIHASAIRDSHTHLSSCPRIVLRLQVKTNGFCPTNIVACIPNISTSCIKPGAHDNQIRVKCPQSRK